MDSPPSNPKIENQNPQWDIDEFASKANQALADKMELGAAKSSDSRLASKMTARNLRRLVSQGAIEPPARSGREAYFGPKHLEQVLAARELMTQGFTSSSIQALRNATAPEPTASCFSNASFQAAPPGSPFSAPSHVHGGATAGLLDSHVRHGAPRAPTTANALLFLSQVAPQESPAGVSERPDPRAAFFSSPAPSSLSSSALSAEAGLANAYQSLGAGKMPPAAEPPPLWVTSALEAEPFAGLRISVRSHPGMAPLSSHQKAAALECMEHLWSAAMAANLTR